MRDHHTALTQMETTLLSIHESLKKVEDFQVCVTLCMSALLCALCVSYMPVSAAICHVPSVVDVCVLRARLPEKRLKMLAESGHLGSSRGKQDASTEVLALAIGHTPGIRGGGGGGRERIVKGTRLMGSIHITRAAADTP